MSELVEAVAAYDAAFAKTGIPADAIFAAAQVLNLPPDQTLNLLIHEGHIVINWYETGHAQNGQMWRFDRACDPKTT